MRPNFRNIDLLSRNHTGREAFEKIVLNFIFLKESHVIENLDQKNCFKTVQKLAKRESGELVSKLIKKIIKVKSSYEMWLRGKCESRDRVNERAEQIIKEKSSYLRS